MSFFSRLFGREHPSLKEARELFSVVKRGTSNHDHTVEHLREALKKAGATLADIGTTEEELQRLRRRNLHLDNDPT